MGEYSMMIDKAGGLQRIGQINRNSDFWSKIQEKLSTGKRINRASDDASGLAMAKELEKMVRGMKQASVNIGDAKSVLNIQDGTANEVSSMVQRQRELALQASNGTLTDTDRKALNTEYQALNEEITRISESSNFNGQSVADGGTPLSDGSGVVQAGAQAGEQRSFQEFDITANGIGAGGDISTAAGAQSAVSQTDDAMKSLNSQRANIGATYNTFEHTDNNLKNQAIQTAAAQSLIEDLDYAQGAMENARAGLLNQTGIAASKNFNEISRNNMLGLLQ